MVILQKKFHRLEKNFLPFIIIEESYLQTFSHSLKNAFATAGERKIHAVIIIQSFLL